MELYQRLGWHQSKWTRPVLVSKRQMRLCLST